MTTPTRDHADGARIDGGDRGEPNRPSFGRLPKDPIEAGLLRVFKPADGLVYLAIVSHVRREGDWTAYPSVRTLVRLTGLSERAVYMSVSRLAKVGALSVRSGGGRRPGSRTEGVSNTYRLATEWPNPAQVCTVSEPNTLHAGAPYPARRCAHTLHRCAPEGEKGKERKNTPRAAAGLRPEQKPHRGRAAVVGVLAGLGIGQPKRSALAAVWRSIPDAPAKIRATADRLRRLGKGNGVLVMELEALAHAERLAADRRAARERERSAIEAKEHADAEAIRAERARTLAIVDGLSESDRAEYKHAAIAAASPFLAKCWRSADPRNNYPLAIEVARLARADARSEGKRRE